MSTQTLCARISYVLLVLLFSYIQKHIIPIATRVDEVLDRLDLTYPKGGTSLVAKNEILQLVLSLGSPHISMILFSITPDSVVAIAKGANPDPTKTVVRAIVAELGTVTVNYLEQGTGARSVG